MIFGGGSPTNRAAQHAIGGISIGSYRHHLFGRHQPRLAVTLSVQTNNGTLAVAVRKTSQRLAFETAATA